MKIEMMIGNNCMGGNCPAVYKTDRGTFIVQGSEITGLEPGQIKLGPNETAVEIPESLVKSLVGQIR